GDAAIDLQQNLPAGGVDRLPRGADLRQGALDEGLPAEPGLHRHDENEVELLQQFQIRSHRRGRFDGDTCLRAELAQFAGESDGGGGGLRVECHRRGAETGVFRRPGVGVLDHQVHIGRDACVFDHLFHHGQTEGEVRYEVVVHDVQMHVVRALDPLDFRGEVGEVGVEDAGRDENGHDGSLLRPAAEPSPLGGAAYQREEHRVCAVYVGPELRVRTGQPLEGFLRYVVEELRSIKCLHVDPLLRRVADRVADHECRFGDVRGAGDVPDYAAGAHGTKGRAEQVPLQGGEFGQVRGGAAPARFRAAAQGTEAGARRVEQHPVVGSGFELPQFPPVPGSQVDRDRFGDGLEVL